MKALPRSFFEQSALALAPQLLGKIIKKGPCAGIIVETEAYGTDPASHAYKITPRSAIMRDTYGCWYVYFTYGMHYCANITCDKEGVGAVLIRAVEPIEGIGDMKLRRKSSAKKSSDLLRLRRRPDYFLADISPSLTNGPAKFCEAFGITKKENGLPLSKDFGIFDAPEVLEDNMVTSPRIGISAGLDLPWRFYIKDNPFVSKK